jgi:hypothetical protein
MQGGSRPRHFHVIEADSLTREDLGVAHSADTNHLPKVRDSETLNEW